MKTRRNKLDQYSTQRGESRAREGLGLCGGTARLGVRRSLAQHFIGGLDKRPVLQPIIAAAAAQHLLLHVLDLHTGRAEAGAQEGLGWVLDDVIAAHLPNAKRTEYGYP